MSRASHFTLLVATEGALVLTLVAASRCTSRSTYPFCGGEPFREGGGVLHSYRAQPSDPPSTAHVPHRPEEFLPVLHVFSRALLRRAALPHRGALDG